ncbi:GrpB family protein [Meiothermus cerbereus]|uniref:GrpB family protein n=1 Tax=Meiothermus cerbereus TaxID=65552 RepID=UPI0004859BD1|nr:GrpB family protein [Meiothermus cerbereus]
MPQPIVVVDYDPSWPKVFERLRALIWPVVQDFALGIEHVGSTSVPGLAAKPIIDMDVIVASPAQIPLAIERLGTLGYVHRGNLGIEGREAFQQPAHLPAHHLYVCLQDSVSLRNHLALRDYLRSHPEAMQVYGALKKRLAQEHAHDIEAYIEAKSDLILSMLAQTGFQTDQIATIREQNRAKP